MKIIHTPVWKTRNVDNGDNFVDYSIHEYS